MTGTKTDVTRSGAVQVARLVVLTGEQAGVEFIIKKTATIGRGDAVIVLEDTSVSRRHAEIHWTSDEGFVITDLGSRHGTCVNGAAGTRHPVGFGDEIEVGRVKLSFTEYDPLEAEILQRQRLAGLGRLGAGIAHDFNNMLAAITANVDCLRSLPAQTGLADHAVQTCLHDIEKAAAHAAKLTPRMLRFAGSDEPQIATVNLSAVSREVIELAERTFDRAIRINFRAQPSLLVLGDAGALHQVLMSLCLHARDRMLPEGGVF